MFTCYKIKLNVKKLAIKHQLINIWNNPIKRFHTESDLCQEVIFRKLGTKKENVFLKKMQN